MQDQNAGFAAAPGDKTHFWSPAPSRRKWGGQLAPQGALPRGSGDGTLKSDHGPRVQDWKSSAPMSMRRCIPEFKNGELDLTSFIEHHRPSVIVYDISLPYDTNRTF